MKSIFKFSLCILSLFLVFSCSDDNSQETLKADKTPFRETTNRNVNNDPFYDLTYVYDLLNVQSDRIGTYVFVDEVMVFLQNNADEESIYHQFKQNNIYPCWHCAEPEFLGFSNYYIPFYHLDDAGLEGILIAQEKNKEKYFYYLSRSVVSRIVETRAEPYSQYWNGILEYFDLDTYPEGREEAFASVTRPCLWFGDVCGCPDITSTGQLSHSPCHILDIMNPDCDEGSCPTGTGGDGNGIEDLDLLDFADWISFDNDEGGGSNTTGGNNSTGGNSNNNNNPDPQPDWNDNCDSYDGSLSGGTILEEGGEIILDESTGTIAIDDLEHLYAMQVAGFINDYGLPYTPEELMNIIGEQCAVSNVEEVNICLKCYFISPLGLPSDESWDLADDFDIVADCVESGDPDCVANTIILNSPCYEALNTFMSLYYGLDLSLEEQMAIVGPGASACGSDGLDEEEAWKEIIDSKTNKTQNETDIAFLTIFLMESNNKVDLLKYYEVIAQIRIEDPLVRWDRATELIDVLKENSNALTECNDPPIDISAWSTLASFVPPQEVLDKLEDLGEGWRLQGFQTPTATPSINLDYFSTTITEMPINQSTGQAWLPDNLFQHIRKNINDFVDIENSEFTPIAGDENLWLSNDPVSAIISIDIDIAGEVGDDGSVICAQNESCCWIFSTVKAPFYENADGDGGNDGYHPVSGNRQFGYTIHPDGSMEIYTKGADRFLSPTSGPFSNSYFAEKLAGYLLEKAAFIGADNLWESFQQGIFNFASDPVGGGASIINTPIKNRPKVKDELKNLLKQSGSINYVPCGN